MGLVVHITSGSRTGERQTLKRAAFLVGRHPECSLRFDAHKDIDVSTRHAEFRSLADGWFIRDLGSTNGTLVNGARITAETAVRAGDVVSLGAHGPRLEIVETGPATEAAHRGSLARRSRSSRPSTKERVAVAVAERTDPLRRLVIGLSTAVVIGVGALLWMTQRNTARSNATIAVLLARSDSLSAALQRTIAEASGRRAGLDSLVRVLQRERAQLSQQLQGGGGNVGLIATQLDALDRRTNQVVELGTSYSDIADANSPGVAFLVVENQAGKPFSGTAFTITPTGLLVTNRHVVQDSLGPARRLGVYVPGDTTFHRARLVRIVEDSTVDLAFVQIESSRRFPTVRGIARSETVRPGDAVVVTGYPLGTTLAPGTSKQPSLGIGAVSKVEADRIHIDAYAAPGSSGSPVFDTSGNVIGVLFGGLEESSGRVIFLVPSSALIAHLRPDERALVR